MASYLGPRISTFDLQIAVDAADKNSYPGSGSVWYDLTPTNKNGSMTSGPTNGFSSEVGGCFNFTGGADYIQFSSTSSYPFATGTLSIWVTSDLTASTQMPMYIIGTSSNRYYLQFGSDNELYFYRGSDLSKRISIKDPYVSGEWYNAVMTYASNGASTTGNFSGFLNGNYVGTNTYAEGASFGGNIYLGSQAGSTQLLDGRIAVFNFYPRVLSNKEIKENFTNLSGRFFGV
jgi:hypothetical protein